MYACMYVSMHACMHACRGVLHAECGCGVQSPAESTSSSFRRGLEKKKKEGGEGRDTKKGANGVEGGRRLG